MHHPPLRSTLGWALPLIASCLLLGSPHTALARQIDGAQGDAEVARAEQKAAQAFAAYEAKRYSEAITLYIEAYDAAPNADMLYNLARIYDTKLGDRPHAITFYRRYIADPGAIPDRIQLANARLALLRDAELAAARPTESGMPEASRSVAPAPAPDMSEATESGWSTPEVIGVIVGATGIVAVGVGAGFGVMAMSEASTARDLCDGNLCREQRGIDAADSASTHATLSTVGIASGSALVAIGAALYFWAGSDPPEQGAPPPTSGVQVGARIAPSLAGWSVELGGSW